MIWSKLLDVFAACSGGSLFGFPPWYKYLPDALDGAGQCTPVIQRASDIWLIVAAVINMMLYVASLVAIGFVVWAGFQFVTSQGEPDRIKKARDTLWDALIGLAITVAATAAVTFVATRFS